jgi:hypothetical protein
LRERRWPESRWRAYGEERPLQLGRLATQADQVGLGDVDGFDAAQPVLRDLELLDVARPRLANDALGVGDAAVDARKQHPGLLGLCPAPRGVGGRLRTVLAAT